LISPSSKYIPACKIRLTISLGLAYLAFAHIFLPCPILRACNFFCQSKQPPATCISFYIMVLLCLSVFMHSHTCSQPSYLAGLPLTPDIIKSILIEPLLLSLHGRPHQIKLLPSGLYLCVTNGLCIDVAQPPMYLSSMYVDLGWHAFTSNLKSATKALQTYYLGRLTKNMLLKTLLADSFLSRISVPNFGVNTGPPSLEYEFSCFELF